ncbi:FHA domain-containing protein [Chitinilyticum aquatile]|uniref:FHA domain-containing protein n=1 Tax=Chitinilyticum aquatile TaxID=362520 RepID=UPI0003FEFCAB|nr:FHA domain-containing protein [Chitinilyticum aquatile]
MAKLLLRREGAILKEFSLNRPRTTIGRRAGNDIQIDNLAVSGSHAAIERQNERYVLIDLESTNGTMINGLAILQQPLKHGDAIQIGRAELLFQLDGTVSTAGFDKTMVMAAPLARLAGVTATRVEADPGVAAILADTERAAAPVPKGRLKLLSGAQAGRELPLVKASTTVGKAGVQVAMIMRQPRGFTLMHVEGAQRPLVNGVDMGLHSHALQNGDVIDLLGVRMAFQLDR